MSAFARYASFFEGICGRLKQRNYIKHYSLQNTRGVCHALCFIYLAMRRNGEKFHLAKDQAPMWHQADELQSILVHGNRSGIFQWVSHGVELVALKTGWKIVGLHPRVAPYVNLSGYIMNSPEKSFILHLGSHACAVFKEQDKNRIRFFDPNYGQAVFKSVEKFSLFLNAFLQDRSIQDKYDIPFGGRVLVMHLQ